MHVTGMELRTKPITAEAFAAFDPEWRYDLLEGQLEPMPPLPGAAHGVFAMVIASYATLFAIDN